MFDIEVSQAEYLRSADRLRVAGEEKARAEILKADAHASCDSDQVAMAALRLAYATKLWESRLREQRQALERYNEALAQEGDRCRAEAELLYESGYYQCEWRAADFFAAPRLLDLC